MPRKHHITTTNGYKILVDEADYKQFSSKTWYFDGRYAVTWVRHPKRRSVCLHALIMQTPKGMVTDHINGDRLDNRRQNLRICTQAENCKGYKGIRSDSKSGVTGVNPYKAKVKWHDKTYTYNYWMATLNGKIIGTFKNREDAIKLREEAYAKLQAA